MILEVLLVRNVISRKVSKVPPLVMHIVRELTASFDMDQWQETNDMDQDLFNFEKILEMTFRAYLNILETSGTFSNGIYNDNNIKQKLLFPIKFRDIE